VTEEPRPRDPLWTRASQWLQAGPGVRPVDVAVLGIPTFKTSTWPTNAHLTPWAVRVALDHYSTWSASHEVDLDRVAPLDMGDVPNPDVDEDAVVQAAAGAAAVSRLVVALGGDNSAAYGLARGLFGANLSSAGVILLDSQQDIRDGVNNSASIRRLVEAGVVPNRIVQVGVADWANSHYYAERAKTWGVRVMSREEVARRGVTSCMRDALDLASRGGGGVLVDLDFDVCDRAAAPACPASIPGGLSALEVREAAFVAGQHQAVRSLLVSEIDASADGADGRTVRLAALCLLEACAGLVRRLR
jgi:formiminoglutamase